MNKIKIKMRGKRNNCLSTTSSSSSPKSSSSSSDGTGGNININIIIIRRSLRKPQFWMFVVVVYAAVCQILGTHYYHYNNNITTTTTTTTLQQQQQQNHHPSSSSSSLSSSLSSLKLLSSPSSSSLSLSSSPHDVNHHHHDQQQHQNNTSRSSSITSNTIPPIIQQNNNSLLMLSGPIFFNIFVPSTTATTTTTTTNKKKDNNKNVRRILKEQFTQLDITLSSANNDTTTTTAAAAAAARNLTTTTAATATHNIIEYTLIGDENFDIDIQNMCRRRSTAAAAAAATTTTTNNDHSHQYTCKQTKYLTVGNEIDTLQNLWEYCTNQQQQNDDDDILVTYLHNKGSYHPTESNERSRRMGTKAALECRLLMLKHPKRCNICTSSFHIFPQYLGSSNMWTAKCSYIKNLHPPNNYTNMLQYMYDSTLNHTELSQTKYACLKPPPNRQSSKNFLGLGRYGAERWPFSHPDVIPCDVIEQKVYMDHPTNGNIFAQTWEPKFKRAPHKPPKQIGIQFGPYKSSFARLAGRLFEWEFVYSKLPNNDSWVWKWYRGYEVGSTAFLKKCNERKRNHTIKTNY